jgi:ATP/maltotriose-dependent transcriptional regulator MalT
MHARVTSSHFVGRTAELTELEQALREAASQRPPLVLIGGDSGVGKTRLVAEFVERNDVFVLRGEAVEQGEGELPYAPIVGALRPLVRARHPALEQLTRASAAQLAGLLPGFEPAPHSGEQQDGAAQLRLFEALLELLDCLSQERPLALILEDMHWADRSTRAFAQFLARSLRDERVLVLLTYRTDELHRRHPLRSLLAELDRLERARRIELAPFDRAEVAEALADIIGAEPSGQLVERLYRRSEGNPLYTEELLAAGVDGRGAAPQSLRDAFMLRIERLSADAQLAARAIAVGRALDEAALFELTGLAPSALQGALREAVGEQVLIAGDDGRFCFRHALLREALYDDLLPGERGELHLALARYYESLEDGQGVGLATAIANHYAAAGDQPAALRAAVQAALAAQDVHAYGEAADLAERALELWPRVSAAQELIPMDHVELLLIAASAHSLGADRPRAEVLLERALGELDESADAHRYASLLARLARLRWSLNRGPEAVETAQRALSLLPADEVSSERASLLAWLARTRHLRGRFREAIAAGEAALALAEKAGSLRSEGEVLNTIGMTRIALGQIDEGIECMRRALEITREDEDVEGTVYAYTNFADALNLAGRTLEALALAREGLAAAPRRMTRGLDWAMMTVSDIALGAGEWALARANLGPPPDQVEGRSRIFRQLREADLALGVGDDDRAAVALEDIEPLVASSTEPQWIGTFGALLAELRRRRGDLVGARAAVAESLDRIELCTDDVARIARVGVAGVRVEADVAQRARDLREKADERDAIKRARIHVQRLRAAAQDGGLVERATHALGAAELIRARGRHEPEPWLKAAGEWEAIDRPYPAGVARLRAAEAYVERGDRTRAVEPARAALETAQRLGAGWLEREVTMLCDRARLVLADGSSGPAPAASAETGPEDPFGLTPRERQVLALIAEGATNRQIGAALYMAEKTASVHVSRILAKLGVRSRTQAAALAHRLGLDRAPVDV